jgi:hypothetical protein
LLIPTIEEIIFGQVLIKKGDKKSCEKEFTAV